MMTQEERNELCALWIENAAFRAAPHTVTLTTVHRHYAIEEKLRAAIPLLLLHLVDAETEINRLKRELELAQQRLEFTP